MLSDMLSSSESFSVRTLVSQFLILNTGQTMAHLWTKNLCPQLVCQINRQHLHKMRYYVISNRDERTLRLGDCRQNPRLIQGCSGNKHQVQHWAGVAHLTPPYPTCLNTRSSVAAGIFGMRNGVWRLVSSFSATPSDGDRVPICPRRCTGWPATGAAV